MSEFQISLLAIGALVVVAVLVFNKLQERKLARGANESFRSRHQDVLLDGNATPDGDGGIKHAAAPVAQTNPEPPAERIEPVIARAEAPKQAGPSGLVDPAVDFVMLIEFAEPVQGDLITSTSEMAALPRARWEGCREAGAPWEQVEGRLAYRTIRAGMQLVSRQGMAQQRDLDSFAAAVSDTANRLGGSLQDPDLAEALQRAQDLDAFCGDVDVQIALHLISRDGTPFAGTKLRGLAEASGMALDADGMFKFRDDAGNVLYAMANKEEHPMRADTLRGFSTRGLTLLLDVPHAPGGLATFRGFVMLAQRLADGLGATLTDDNGNALGERSFNAIAVQLAAIHQTMEARGVAAGSPLALRLFS